MSLTVDNADWISLSTRDGRCRFIAQLAAANLDSLKLARFNRLRREVTALLEVIKAGPLPPALKGRQHRKLHPAIGAVAWLAPITDAPILVDDARWITKDELEKLHAWLQEGFRRLASDETWLLEPMVQYELDFYNGLLSYRIKAASNRDTMALCVFELLRDSRGRFRKCRRCGTPFFPVRRQSYCSGRCSQTTRTAAWRSSKRETG